MAEEKRTVAEHLMAIRRNLYEGKPIEGHKKAIQDMVDDCPYKDYYLKCLEATEQWSDTVKIDGDFSENFKSIAEDFDKQGILASIENGKKPGIVLIW